MRCVDHPLQSPSLGVHKTLKSFHFGPEVSTRKLYIQASLHAEELPGMLVAHHLRGMLERADAAGQLTAQVVLVPVANPIGLAQRLDHKPMGRFEFDTAENFNRHYPDLAKAILESVKTRLGADPERNVQVVRESIGSYLSDWKPTTELQSLRRTLLLLSYDADYVLDLHCDCEAVMHFYCEEACWNALEPLAHFLGSQAVLLAKNSGSQPFDECLSGVWWQLSQALASEGMQTPLRQGCASTTIELRGEGDVSHELALKDAQAIADFLRHIGALKDVPPKPVPAALCRATPLAGSETLNAPAAGVVVFARPVGTEVAAGELIAEVIDPLANAVNRVCAGVDGLLYARTRDRYVTTGAELCKIAGAVPFRTGELLGA